MNPMKLHPMAFLWPFCALAAHYDEDSGDGDNNLSDFIDDTVQGWFPGATVHRFFDPSKLDFTYAVEHDGGLIVAFLGTEGKATGPGWRDDLSPGIETKEFKEHGGHRGFIEAGELAAGQFVHLVAKYIDNFMVVMHSRGGARGVSALRSWNRSIGAFPLKAFAFCSPAVFNHSSADEYDKSGLGAVTFRPTMKHDPVDLLGLPILKHVGTEIPLPHVHSEYIKSGIGGWLVGGHAYSSVFDALLVYFKGYGPETKWLSETRWVAEV